MTSPLPAVFYPDGNVLQRGDRVQITPSGFGNQCFTVDSRHDGQIGIVLHQVPFLNVAQLYFPMAGETSVKAGQYVMVEPTNLTLMSRCDDTFTLPALKKYAELEMLASWMQCSVSSQESINRYEELSDPEGVEKLCEDYHELAAENASLKQAMDHMAGLMRTASESTRRIFGLGELSDELKEAARAYENKNS
jgi:hypothetical protein